jgi:peptidyl-prolyl cis-trans isomerase D
MISWIQKYFQHHFKTIFAVLLAGTIISFIFTIGAAPGIGQADRRVTERRVFGYNLASQEDQSRLFGDASLSAQLQSGYGLDGAELQNYGLERAAALHIANQLHLPAASKAEIADYIKTLRVFQGEDGQFDAKRYATFRDSLKGNPRITEATATRVLADDVRISKVHKLLAGPGYVQPADVTSLLERADTKWTLAVASVDYASYAPTIPTGDAELTRFFEEGGARYDIPPRVVVSYVGFPAINFLGGVAVTETDVRAYYETNPARFPAPAAAAKPATPVDPNAAFNAVRPQVETALRLERAQLLAVKAASDFSFALYESKATPGTAVFDSVLASQKLALKTLAPFTREEGPAEFGGSPEIAEEAFKLSADRRTSDAVSTPSGAAVLFWQETQPSRKPAFAEVRAKVAADYAENEKRKRFVEAGRTLHAAIENRIKAGDTFEKAVSASANGLKVETKQLTPFTLRQPAQDADYTVLRSLDRFAKGKVSDMIIDDKRGLLVYVVDKQTPDLSDKNPEYAATRAQIAAMNSRQSSGAYLNMLVEEELKRSEPTAAK